MKDKYVHDRIDQLEEHLRNPEAEATVDSVVDHAFYSYRHANRLFKALKGESIQAYVKKYRLQSAAEALWYTSIPVYDIALEAGYESTAAFSKAFKKCYGDAPSAFRKKGPLNQVSDQVDLPKFEIRHFSDLRVQAVKVVFSPTVSEEDFFAAIQAAYQEAEVQSESWMLLWTEDPDLSILAESRLHLGWAPSGGMAALADGTEMQTLEGRYAIFDAADFKPEEYEIWHAWAILALGVAGHRLAESPYIEWFNQDAFDSLEAYLPCQIGVPIV